MKGLDTTGELSFDNMKEIVITTFQENTSVYNAHLANFQIIPSVTYARVKTVMKAYHRTLLKSKLSDQTKMLKYSTGRLTCFACGKPGHKIGDPKCPKYNSKSTDGSYKTKPCWHWAKNGSCRFGDIYMRPLELISHYAGSVMRHYAD